ncbi:glutaredoxin family protein [Parasulfuritortus cantonensis]|uniref:Glutaredoxin family protein n=1 Tax=Parasulfuritortus cantonensis TaxID=2528202 RepID=A0A4R1BQF9_9PROT|nr:glutaredoxin family protein [Parasulfuritortus cantonensis]TCJ19517.1 glutaredoxin family protein [Parasulfuritortus cantonensis]
MTELVLYTRAGCHLCDEMKAGLVALAPTLEFTLREVEVGWDGEVAERYGQLLPVLELAGRELCRYFLDPDAVRAALA